ncbi:MAG TPA: antiactivator of flagellar biosynthesis FleN protein [Paucimonas sp.]|nr:antiactivator of flagellar biosynthesis FleN protein [Paucimonas sp.]
MASFDFDQAEGLRRMLAGPKPRIVTFLSAIPTEEKNATLVNLSASLARAGSEVLLLDACPGGRGVAARLDVPNAATLLEVARQERGQAQVVQATQEGFGLAMLARGPVRALPKDAAQLRRLSNSFGALSRQTDIMLIDAELCEDDGFPLPAMGGGDIVVQVRNSAASIKEAYALVKRLNAQLGRRPFGVLVTGAGESEAKRVFDNMAQAASRYLAVQLHSLGSVPADEHVKRAARLGRTVVDAFPLAGASVAFRQLAGRVAAANDPGRRMQGATAGGA